MKKNRALPLRDAWLIWFILGVVMLNYPFLHIFNKDVLIFGTPLTILYFFIGWPLSIGVVYLFSVYLGRGREAQTGTDDQDDTQPPQEQP